MSRLWYYACDGACGEKVESIPPDWKTVETWDDGSITLHFCPECKARALTGRK